MAALFIIAPNWKQPKYPSTDKWANELWNIYTMYTFILCNKKERTLIHTKHRREPQVMMLSQRS